jgi:hypothetical protein
MASSSNTSDVTQYLDASVIERCYKILFFHLEAVIYLERWPEVEPFIRATSTIDNDHARSIMADMILTSEKMPLEHVICSLQVSLPCLTKSSQLTFDQRNYSTPFNTPTPNVSASLHASSTYACTTG